MKQLSLTGLFCLGIALYMHAGTYSGGSGTEADPYQISTLADLSELCQTSADFGSYFELSNNIDASQTQFWDDTDDNSDGDLYNDPNDALAAGTNEGFFPIGNTGDDFTGFFNGNNFEISNLTINRPTENYVGFFGYLHYAEVSNLGLLSVDIHAKQQVGGFVGLSSRSSIDNCYCSGSVRSEYINAGGFAGSASSYSTSYTQLISNCHSSCTVFSEYTTSNETIGAYGGFVGNNGSLSEIINCYATGNVTVKAARAGGFVGRNGQKAKIYQCYSTGNVSGRNSVGGFAGYQDNQSWLKNCYSHGSASRGENLSLETTIGGFCGNNSGSYIQYCYCTGNVHYAGAGVDDPTNQGFMGNYFVHGGEYIEDNFFDATISNQSGGGDDGATAKTTAEMYLLTTYTDLATVGLTHAWDFYGTPNDDAADNDYWDIDNGNAYPVLSWQNQEIEWTGATDTDWEKAENWTGSMRLPPMAIHNITIPATANDPIITTGTEADCNDLIVAAGATLSVNSGGSLITNGEITNNGIIQVKRTMSPDVWHLISSPVSGATASMFVGHFLQTYDESTQLWSDVTLPGLALSAGQGFSHWADGPGDISHTFIGTPNNGTVLRAMTYTNNGNSMDGFNLVGNPYPSSIDWDQLAESYGTLYYWDSENTQYDTWSQSGATNGGQQYVPAALGFYVYSDVDQNFSLSNDCRTHTNAGSFYKNDNQNLTERIRLEAANASLSSNMLLVFNENAKAGFEKETDAWKLFSGEGVPDIYSIVDQDKLALDVRPQSESIQIGFRCAEAGIYSISLTEGISNQFVQLEDTRLNIFHNLMEGDYSFHWTAADQETRFKLHIGTTAIDETAPNRIQLYVSGDQIVIHSEEEVQRIVITDMAGRTIAVWNNTDQIPAPKAAGIYLITIETNNNTITERIVIQ